MIKEIIRDTFLYNLYLIHYIELLRWKARGKPIPPPYSVKRQIIKEYAKRFSCQTFIESGTYFGETVYAVRCNFKEIFSIELDTNLYEKAKNRFARFPHIKILHGDSRIILPKILPDISVRCLFWLDGHYSTGITAKGDTTCPIISELETIISRKSNNDVILVDDARLYVGKGDWPHIEELRKSVSNLNPDFAFGIKDDIIRIHSRI
jgi:hypothetical protein